MEPSTATVATLVIAGGLVIAAATFVAVRGPAPPPSARSQRWAPLVPWLGSGLAVVLAVRGALAGAAFVALATLVHALVARWQAVRGRGASPPEG